MSSDGDIQVGIISSRPTLDLAINTWLPGYRARSSTDLDVVVDLTQDGGVIVIDLLQGEGPELIRELRDRGVDRPIVVLASESQTYEPPMSGDVIVANSATIEELSAAFGEARARHRSRALLDAGGVGRRPGTEHQAAAGPHRSGGASTDQAVFDLRGTPIPRTPNAMTSEDNKTRTKDVTPPFGLKFGRRSRRARALLQDAVVDVHTERADTGTSPASRTDQGSPPIDTEPLEVIDLTEPLFRSGDRRAGASGRSVPRDASRPPIPTTESSPSAPTAASTAPAPRVG